MEAGWSGYSSRPFTPPINCGAPHRARRSPEWRFMRFHRPGAALGLVLFAAACERSSESTSPPLTPEATLAVGARQQERIGPGVREAILRDGGARVVISLGQSPAAFAVRGRADVPGLTRAVAAVQLQAFSALLPGDLDVAHQFEAVPAIAGTLRREGALMRLAMNSAVRRIDLDIGGTGSLATSVPQINADQRQANGNSGAGIVVGVLDSGIDSDHPDLADDIGPQACFGDNDGTIDGAGFCPNGSDRQTGAGAAEDDHGHGTHVSGIISSNGTNASVGVAPGATIVAVKVLNSNNGFQFTSEVIAGLNWIITNNNAGLNLGVQVINMSLGTNTLYTSPCDNADAITQAMAAAINTLRGTGVLTVVSSGNNGSGTQMGLPACVGATITVGAVNAADAVANFSNSDATTDVFAPGTNVEGVTGITSSRLGGGTVGLQGTSMAAPHVAGCIALLIESGDATTANAIETRLETSAVQVTDPTNGLTFPRVDCAPAAPPPATITIRKTTIPAGRTGFSFTHTIAAPNAFTLDHGGSATFTDVAPGSYTVTEGAPGSFMTLTNIVCTDPSGGTTINLATRSASINAAAGETVDCTFTNSDLPPTVNAAPATQSVQYSDGIGNITVTAQDSDQDALSATFTHSVNGGAFAAGLPAGLSSAANACNSAGGVKTCTWTISGTAGVPAGTYTVRSTVADDDGSTASKDVAIVVAAEDATVSFSGSNPVGVQVSAPGGTSAAFALTVYVEETEPDLATVSAAAGNIGNATVAMNLVPVGPGNTVAGSCAPVGVTGSGYTQVLEVSCNFSGAPVNTYTATATITGGYYAGGSEDVVTVFDPSLGFTTGGGSFLWPGTTDRTTFGYTMKYKKNGANASGSLLVIRHLADGTKYRLKSNALGGLAIGDGGTFDWASFTGKATYLQPGWPDALGNYGFVAYVEDHGTPGRGDRFWLQVHDRSGKVVSVSSMTAPAAANAATLTGGNIVVPH